MTTQNDGQRRRWGRRVDAGDRWHARYDMLIETLARVGVDLSDDDHTAVEHVARWEPETARAIASWVIRAAAAQRPGLAALTAGDHTASTAPPSVTPRLRPVLPRPGALRPR